MRWAPQWVKGMKSITQPCTKLGSSLLFKAPGTVQRGFPGEAHVLLGELNALVESTGKIRSLTLGRVSAGPP